MTKMNFVDFADKIELLRASVKTMLGNQNQNHCYPLSSDVPIWTDVSKIFEYVVNLSVEDFLLTRLHTSLITGEFLFSYWHKYPPFKPDSFADVTGYKALTEDVPKKYWIGEPPLSSIDIPLGINYNGKIINKNISRYQSCISNLYHMGILENLSKSKDKKIIIEIGGGYGGLAHHIGQVLGKKTIYIIIDLPIMLMFSGSYLILNNHCKKIYIYNSNTFTKDFVENKIFDYDFLLLPPNALHLLQRLKNVSLVINMMSFQEMTQSQIEEYAKFCCNALSGYLYSNNIDRHPLNNHLGSTNLTEILDKYFDLFPSPQIYEDSSLNSEHPWYYKFYFGIPKGKNRNYPQNCGIKIRAYVPEKQVTPSGLYPQQWKKIEFNQMNTIIQSIRKQNVL